MAKLKQLYKLKNQATRTDALDALHAHLRSQFDSLHTATESRFPQHIKDQFAGMGRNGDTQIRNIDNKPAHVTGREATLLDTLGNAIVPQIKQEGAGTINPKTGMKEYHEVDGETHSTTIEGHYHTGYGGSSVGPGTVNVSYGEDAGTAGYTGEYSTGTGVAGASYNQQAQDWEMDVFGGNVSFGGTTGEAAEDRAWKEAGFQTGQLSTDEFMQYGDSMMSGYLDVAFDIGAGGQKYITGKQDEPFEFMKKRYSSDVQKGTRDIMGQQEKLMGQTGMATSGSVTQLMGQQKEDMMKELTLGYEEEKYQEADRQRQQFYDEIAAYKAYQ